MDIGKQVLRIRKEKGLTIKDVSMMSGVTPSLISQIEHNKANPSLATLLSLANSFNINVIDFFKDDDANNGDSPVIRSSERRLVKTGVKAEYYLLTSKIFDNIEFLYCIYEEGGASSKEMISHSESDKGYEAGIILSGKFKVELEDQVYILNAGDSIYFKSCRPHRITNISESVGTAIWIDSPASF